MTPRGLAGKRKNSPSTGGKVRFLLPKSAFPRSVFLCDSIEKGSLCALLGPGGPRFETLRDFIGGHRGDGCGHHCLVLPDGLSARGTHSKMLFELLLFFLG